MTPHLIVRVKFPVDDRALSELHARAFAHPLLPDVVHIQPWAARLERHSIAWVGVFEADALVGFVHACWDGGAHAFLLDAVVDPDHQRSGIGTLLVERLISEVRATTCEWLHVDYQPHLREFYRACGFGPTPAGLIRLT